MEKIVVELDVKSKGGVQEVEKLNKKLTETKTQSKEAGASLDGVSGGAIGKFKGLQSSISGVVTGFKSLKFAILASGIGALLLAVLAVGKAFTSSEEGQDKFAKIMAVIGSVTGNLLDILSDLGEKIISVFENPKQAIIDFKDAFVKNITNRISSAIETVGFLGTAIKKVFSGDFSGAMDDAKKAGSSYIDTLTGVKGTIDKITGAVKNMTDEITKDAKTAANIANQRANADKLDRALIVERAEANRKRAELLDKAAQKEKFTAKERIEFLKEAGEIEDEITAKEITAARIRFNTKVAENSLSKSTKEDLLEEANLKAKLIDLETAKLSKKKAVSAQIVGAEREEAADIKAIQDKAIADRKAIQELEANTEEEKRVLALEKEKEKFDEAIVLATQQGLSIEELERSQKESLQLMRDGFAQSDIDRVAKKASDEKAIKDKAIAEDAELTRKQIELEAQKTAAKDKALNDLASIFGAESAMGKAALIAKQLILAQELLIDLGAIKSKATKAIVTSQLNAAESGGAIATGFSKTLSLGFPAAIPALIGYAATAIGVVSGVLAATKKTKSVASQFGGGGGGGSPTITAPSIASIPPAFNVVGQSSTNQLASAIGGQSQQPVKAYVVSTDMTNAQQLDRNIIQGASI